VIAEGDFKISGGVMRKLGSILIALTVVACGGGGGGNGSPAPNNPGPGPNPGGPSSSSASVVMQREGLGAGYEGTVWSFNPASVTIARGGTVTWTNGLNESHNVIFAQAAGAPANVPEHTSGSNSRTFSSSGTFNYQCTIHPMAGQVVVQ
jgi:plastocyanin